MNTYSDLFNRLTDNLRKIYGDYLQAVILYGSVARGTETEESDIDIAVLVTDDNNFMHDAMMDITVDLELDFGKVISILIIDLNDYLKWNCISPFYRNVKEEGIVLWKAA